MTFWGFFFWKSDFLTFWVFFRNVTFWLFARKVIFWLFECFFETLLFDFLREKWLFDFLREIDFLTFWVFFSKSDFLTFCAKSDFLTFWVVFRKVTFWLFARKVTFWLFEFFSKCYFLTFWLFARKVTFWLFEFFFEKLLFDFLTFCAKSAYSRSKAFLRRERRLARFCLYHHTNLFFSLLGLLELLDVSCWELPTCSPQNLDMPKGEAKEEVFQLVEITETIDPGVKSGVDRETATPSMFWLNSSPNVNVRRFWGQHISSKLWFFVASQCDFFVDSKVYQHIHQTMIF